MIELLGFSNKYKRYHSLSQVISFSMIDIISLRDHVRIDLLTS